MKLSEIVPPMTHPYGKVWDQPKLDQMLYDPLEDVVIMTQKTWDSILMDYSHSTPSALYIGKAWAAKDSMQIRWVEDPPLGWETLKAGIVMIISKRVVIH